MTCLHWEIKGLVCNECGEAFDNWEHARTMQRAAQTEQEYAEERAAHEAEGDR